MSRVHTSYLHSKHSIKAVLLIDVRNTAGPVSLHWPNVLLMNVHNVSN